MLSANEAIAGANNESVVIFGRVEWTPARQRSHKIREFELSSGRKPRATVPARIFLQ